MRRLWRHIRNPGKGSARYRVLGKELSIDIGFPLDVIPLPRLHHYPGWYIAFTFGNKSTDPLILIEYDYGTPP